MTAPNDRAGHIDCCYGAGFGRGDAQVFQNDAILRRVSAGFGQHCLHIWCAHRQTTHMDARDLGDAQKRFG